jgi:ATP adenylyltransferase
MEPAGIGTVSGLTYWTLGRNGCRGFIGPVPPPLWMRSYVGRGLYAGAQRKCNLEPPTRMTQVANQRLWAPWRLPWIKSGKTDECIFCTKPTAGDDETSLIPYRGERCFVMLNAFPYNSGHVMAAPYEHTAGLQELEEPTASELMSVTQRSLRALERAYGPEGYNVGINLGRVAGAGMADHVHVHVVPRWTGDTSFMPVIADTDVLPERLEDTYRVLREAFAQLPA